jgi:hypothetical protein
VCASWTSALRDFNSGDEVDAWDAASAVIPAVFKQSAIRHMEKTRMVELLSWRLAGWDLFATTII